MNAPGVEDVFRLIVDGNDIRTADVLEFIADNCGADYSVILNDEKASLASRPRRLYAPSPEPFLLQSQ